MGARLMAIVAEGDRGRVYLAPTPEMEAIALSCTAEWKPEIEFCREASGFHAAHLRPDDLSATSSPPANSWR